MRTRRELFTNFVPDGHQKAHLTDHKATLEHEPRFEKRTT